jgi:predicted RNase H-like HicB family nuclease
MATGFTAVIRQDGDWWIGWIEEIPGVNTQGRSRAELVRNLRSALGEALEMNRERAIQAARGPYEELVLQP